MQRNVRNRTGKKVTFAKSEEIHEVKSQNFLKGFSSGWFHLCRILFSFCILIDAAWYFYSLESRLGYYVGFSVPVWLVSLVIVSYAFLSIRILINYKLEQTCLAMVIAYAVVAFIIRHPVGSGGLGDYPRSVHGEINFLQIFSYIGLIGGILVMLGYDDMMERKQVMEGTNSYAVVLGRPMIALCFMFETFLFKVYYFEEKINYLNSIGKNPLLYLFTIGTVNVLASYFAWYGKTTLSRKFGALCLAFMTLVQTVNEIVKAPYTRYDPPVKIEAQVHYVIVQSKILIGCLLLFAVSSLQPQPYKKEAD